MDPKRSYLLFPTHRDHQELYVLVEPQVIIIEVFPSIAPHGVALSAVNLPSNPVPKVLCTLL